MALKLYNTPTKKLETFTPSANKTVTLYTCGPTVYNHPHIGNWASYIYWDILVRVLLANDYKVVRAMNITDVGHLVSDGDSGEDKLEKGARREGKTAWAIADYYTEYFLEGMKKLNMIQPEHIVRATDYIPEQLNLIRTLKNKGYTYQIDDGIYFDASKFANYADFAHLDLESQKAGTRVVFNEQKRNPYDFALWKFTPEGHRRDMEWDTPEDLLDDKTPRKGFPGWHLECSAIAMKTLGTTIDIHTGGIDHVPIHHTNEIAQSEAATGKKFSRYWLHNNHIKSDGTKISKSLGNTYTLEELEQDGFSPMDLRMFVLQGQYSNEGNFTLENLKSAKNRLDHWKNIASLRWQTFDTITEESDKKITLLATRGAMIEALNDNLNTPKALYVVEQAMSKFEGKSPKNIHQYSLINLVKAIDDLLGLDIEVSTPDITEEQKELIINRNRAREEKDWNESDRIRDTLKEQGIELLDLHNESIWRRIYS